MIRVAIVDDHPIVLQGLEALLARRPGIEVTGTFKTCERFLDSLSEAAPDVVVFDVHMAEAETFDAMRRARDLAPQTKVLMFSGDDAPEVILAGVKAGARGHLIKTAPPDRLEEAIQILAGGGAFFDARASSILATQLTEAARAPERPALSRREEEVLTHIAEGLSNKEIARRLFISVRTVEGHRESLIKKLGIRSVARLTRFALAHGYISMRPDDPRP